MTTATLDTTLENDFPAAQRGDRVAFARLVQATQRMVASVALAVTRDVALSEDIAQDTYLAAWQRLADMSSPHSFLPWLRQVARNRAIDQVRRRGLSELTLDAGDTRIDTAAGSAPEPADAHEREQQRELLARALDEIPDSSREVLLLFYREGQSSRNVAALLGMSDAAVRKRLQRARDGLQAELLQSVGELASRSAPGVAFTHVVASGLAAGSGSATASSAAAGVAGKWVLGSVFAALGVVLGAVAIEVRMTLKKARNPAEHRALLRHGVIYALLMASYVGILFWSKYADWSLTTTLLVAAGYSLAIFSLAFVRIRIHKRHRG